MPLVKRVVRYGPLYPGQAEDAWAWRRYLVGFLWERFDWCDLLEWSILGRPVIRRKEKAQDAV